MRNASWLPTMLAAATFSVVFVGGGSAAEALHCPGPRGSFVWGTCIGGGDEPGGQTVVDGSADIQPSLGCVDASLDFETSGELQWCQSYTLRVANNCESALEFDDPVLAGDNRRILSAGEEAAFVGLQACVEAPRAQSGHLADAGLDARDATSDASDAADPTAADAADPDTDSVADPPPDTTVADTGGDTAADTGDTDAGPSLSEVCDAFESPSAPGDHSASYAFTHAGSSYELVQSVETIAFEEWYDEECGDESGPRDTGTAADSGGSMATGDGGNGACSCTAGDSSTPPIGSALAVVLFIGALRRSGRPGGR